MRYAITNEVQEFLKVAIGSGRGVSADICRRYDIPPPVLSRVLGGSKAAVDESTWLRLCSAYPQLRGMGRPYIRNSSQRKSPPPSSEDMFRLRLQDAILGETRLDDATKMLFLQIVSEVAYGQ